MLVRLLLVLIVLIALALGGLYIVGTGRFVEPPGAGVASGSKVSGVVVASRQAAIRESALDVGVARPKQILFGDLHVHTTFSFDAFQMSLPMAGGDGAHPVADACDFARHCSGLDFWSINDHAITLTPRRWSETLASMRQCNEIGGGGANPDLVSYLGWEWTQVGTAPENHYGHKNVILRDLADEDIPARPISAGTPPGLPDQYASPLLLGLLAVAERDTGGPALAEYLHETMQVSDCPTDVAVRDLPLDCREIAPTPDKLFAKLDDWGHETMVIPHGTTWGFYTSLGSAWDKQLTPQMHDPARQQIVEVYSGHGNSEEYRSFREVLVAEDGSRSCPGPQPGYLPSCWRAGQIIEERCLDEGLGEDECAERAERARQYFVDAGFNAGAAVVGDTEVADWGDAGQCVDCFQPSFNYRPKSSVQYMMALGREDESGDPLRFRFGFIGSSDNHSARPGTGYKPVARTEFTETRFGNFADSILARGAPTEEFSEPRKIELSDITSPFLAFETERQASFFLNGGLAAVHSNGRDRDSIWDALERREVYGTSGPRILLWFDLLNAPKGTPAPMGSEVELADAPIFQVRAVGSFEQKPGCPPDALRALEPARLARLCQGECYHPSDRRRPIDRIEIVRIRPQQNAREDVNALIEDPWKVLPCPGDPSGCRVAFSDPEYPGSTRDVLYYARAIEEASPAVDADPLGCTRDASGACISVDPCFGRPADDECLADTEHRAWSSPIFLNPAGGVGRVATR